MSEKKTTSFVYVGDSQTVKHLQTELARQSQTTSHLQTALANQPSNQPTSRPSESKPATDSKK